MRSRNLYEARLGEEKMPWMRKKGGVSIIITTHNSLLFINNLSNFDIKINYRIFFNENNKFLDRILKDLMNEAVDMRSFAYHYFMRKNFSLNAEKRAKKSFID